MAEIIMSLSVYKVNSEEKIQDEIPEFVVNKDNKVEVTFKPAPDQDPISVSKGSYFEFDFPSVMFDQTDLSGVKVTSPADSWEITTEVDKNASFRITAKMDLSDFPLSITLDKIKPSPPDSAVLPLQANYFLNDQGEITEYAVREVSIRSVSADIAGIPSLGDKLSISSTINFVRDEKEDKRFITEAKDGIILSSPDVMPPIANMVRITISPKKEKMGALIPEEKQGQGNPSIKISFSYGTGIGNLTSASRIVDKNEIDSNYYYHIIEGRSGKALELENVKDEYAILKPRNKHNLSQHWKFEQLPGGKYAIINRHMDGTDFISIVNILGYIIGNDRNKTESILAQDFILKKLTGNHYSKTDNYYEIKALVNEGFIDLIGEPYMKAYTDTDGYYLGFMPESEKPESGRLVKKFELVPIEEKAPVNPYINAWNINAEVVSGKWGFGGEPKGDKHPYWEFTPQTSAGIDNSDSNDKLEIEFSHIISKNLTGSTSMFVVSSGFPGYNPWFEVIPIDMVKRRAEMIGDIKISHDPPKPEKPEEPEKFGLNDKYEVSFETFSAKAYTCTIIDAATEEELESWPSAITGDLHSPSISQNTSFKTTLTRLKQKLSITLTGVDGKTIDDEDWHKIIEVEDFAFFSIAPDKNRVELDLTTGFWHTPVNTSEKKWGEGYKVFVVPFGKDENGKINIKIKEASDKEIYSIQQFSLEDADGNIKGIFTNNDVLKEGIQKYKDDGFTFYPPKPGNYRLKLTCHQPAEKTEDSFFRITIISLKDYLVDVGTFSLSSTNMKSKMTSDFAFTYFANGVRQGNIMEGPRNLMIPVELNMEMSPIAVRFYPKKYEIHLKLKLKSYKIPEFAPRIDVSAIFNQDGLPIKLGANKPIYSPYPAQENPTDLEDELKISIPGEYWLQKKESEKSHGGVAIMDEGGNFNGLFFLGGHKISLNMDFVKSHGEKNSSDLFESGHQYDIYQKYLNMFLSKENIPNPAELVLSNNINIKVRRIVVAHEYSNFFLHHYSFFLNSFS